MLQIIWFWYSAGLSCAKVTKVAPKLLIAWAISQRIECIHLRSWEADRMQWTVSSTVARHEGLLIWHGLFWPCALFTRMWKHESTAKGLQELAWAWQKCSIFHLSQPAQANHSYLLKIATPVSAHVPTWTWSPAACSHYPALVQTVPSNRSAKR